MTARIEVLQSHQAETAATTITRAFHSDPMFQWIFPDAAQRLRSLQILNRVPVKYGMRYGHATQSHQGNATAIWLPPGGSMSILGFIRCGMLKVPFGIGFGAFGKFARANETMEKIHKKLVPEPHWYLLIVAVAPELQGKGIGSALVQDGLDRADREKVPCYLETSERRNIPFYEGYGFSVVAEATLGSGAPPAWAMRRAVAL